MDISTIGTVNSFVKAAEYQKKACESVQSAKRSNTDRAEFSSRADSVEPEETREKKTVSELIEEQSEKIREIFGDTEEEREKSKLCSIRMKIYSGKTLTPDEEAYLERKDSNAYSNYQQNQQARKMYRSMLKSCRTRDQVNAMRLSNSLSALSEYRKSSRNGGGNAVAGMNAALERETADFVKSSDFKRLPSAAECDKFDRDLAKARKFEREKIAAKRKEALEKRRKARSKRKSAQKTPGDGKQTVAQVMSSPNARKVLASRRRSAGTSAGAAEGVSFIYKMNFKA